MQKILTKNVQLKITICEKVKLNFLLYKKTLIIISLLRNVCLKLQKVNAIVNSCNYSVLFFVRIAQNIYLRLHFENISLSICPDGRADREEMLRGSVLGRSQHVGKPIPT